MNKLDIWVTGFIIVGAIAWVIRFGAQIKSRKGATLCNGCSTNSKPKIREFKSR